MSILGKVSEQYLELVNFFIRPPRDVYADEDLGPPLFRLAGKKFRRVDLEIINRRNMLIKCSHFEPCPSSETPEPQPCVVYLHGNCSSRVEALSALPVLLPQNISVFCFDFSGSGQSEGEYLSLGWWEREDLDSVVEHLRRHPGVSTVGVWGRSMGAVTALMHAHRDPTIGGILVDSPFASLRRLAEELGEVALKISMPRFLLSWLLNLIRTSILSKANFDINAVSPIDTVSDAFIPALFVCGKSDTFIDPSHTRDLFAAYGGDKNILEVEGGHNSPRPAFMLHSAAIFFHNTLRPSAIPHALPAAPRDEDEALLDARAEAASPRTRPGGVEGSRLLSDADGLSDFSESNSSDSSGSEAESSATGSELGDSRRRERDGAALPAARLAVQYPFLEEKASPASSSQSASQIEKRATAEEGAASLSAAISVDASSSARPRSLSPQPQPQGGPEGAARKVEKLGQARLSEATESGGGSRRRQSLLLKSGFFTRRRTASKKTEARPQELLEGAADDGVSPWEASKLTQASQGALSSAGAERQTPARRRPPTELRPVVRQRSSSPQKSLACDAAAAGETRAGQSGGLFEMAPPQASFNFFNEGGALDPNAFVEEDDAILQRAISISLEEFIREQQNLHKA